MGKSPSPSLRKPFFLLGEDEMLEEQAPDEVDPAEDESEEGDDDGEDQGDETLLLQEVAPADTNLDDPVDERDEEKDELDKTTAAVEPFLHGMYLPYLYRLLYRF